MIRIILLALLFGFFSLLKTQVRAEDVTGAVFSHDPATIYKDGDTYWHFYTAPGINSSTSKNLKSWSPSGKLVFSLSTSWKETYPSWTSNYLDPNGDGNLWAPDVIYMDSAYYLYYSVSSFGSSKSAIGVVRSPSLNNPSWEELGIVVSSDGSSTAINAIDPGLFRDTDGKIYMVYGSWFGGIGIVEIDSVTGLATTTTTHLYGGSHQSIEAPYLFKEDSIYYLVVNRGLCCRGVNSTYYITVGRSTNVMGPYEGWRTILETEGKYIGPGHFGLLREDTINYVSTHYYNKNANGYATLGILKMTMVDGWPSLTRDFNFDGSDPNPVNINIYSNADNDFPIKLYPNPTVDGIFYIDLPELEIKGQLSIWIYTIEGKQVFYKEFIKPKNIQMESPLVKGIYIIKTKYNNEVFTSKLSVQ